MFITLLHTSFDAKTGNLRYVRAGHVPQFLRRAGGGIERLGAAAGPPLGLKADAAHRSSSINTRSVISCWLPLTGSPRRPTPPTTNSASRAWKSFSRVIRGEERHPMTRPTAAVRTFEAGQPEFDDRSEERR